MLPREKSLSGVQLIGEREFKRAVVCTPLQLGGLYGPFLFILKFTKVNGKN